MKRLIGFAQLIRLPNSFTAVSNILAAHVVVTAGAPLWNPLILTLIASLCFYHGGMILNDCFDFTEDQRTRPDRPLPRGLISLSFAWSTGFVLLLIGLVLTFYIGLLTFLIACGLAILIVFYNLSSRENFTGCVAMGGCRFLNWCIGLSIVPEFVSFLPYAMLVGLYVTALTMISRDETHANRPQWVMYCTIVMVLGALVFALILWLQGALTLIGGAVLVVGLGIILQRLTTLRREYHPKTIQSTVMFFVLGLIPLDAAMVLIAGYPLEAVLIALLIFPSRVLASRMYVT